MNPCPNDLRPSQLNGLVCALLSAALGWDMTIPRVLCPKCSRSADDPWLKRIIADQLAIRVAEHHDWDSDPKTMRQVRDPLPEAVRECRRVNGPDRTISAVEAAVRRGLPLDRAEALLRNAVPEVFDA